MDKNKLEEAVKAKTTEKNGKLYIACNTAFGIAEKYNVAPIEIGNICNELKIKIMNCQLGCF